MNLKQLVYFCKVVESGSISQAAKLLFVAPTAISMQISALEEQLGGELLNRSTRPMALTKLGEFFYSRSQELIYDFNKLESDTELFINNKSAVLNIGFTRSVMFNILPEAIKKFKERYAHVQINLTEVLSEYQSEMLINGAIDIGITRELENDNFVSESLEHRLILVDPMVAAIPRDHYLSRKLFLTLRDFVNSPFIIYPKDDRSGFAGKFFDMFIQRQCQPMVSYRAIEIHTALALVGAGLGVTLVGKSTIPNNRQDVLFLPIQDFNISSYIYSVCRSDNNNSLIADFIDVLEGVSG